MKKIHTYCLIFVLITLLCGCANTKEKSQATTDDSTSVGMVTDSDVKLSEDNNDNKQSDDISVDNADKSGNTDTVDPVTGMRTLSDLSDFTIYDGDGIIFKIDSIDANGKRGYTINFYIENNTSKALQFSVVDGTLNGWMLDPYWSEQVSAGSSTYSNLVYENSDLKELDVQNPSDIMLEYCVYEAFNSSAGNIVRDSIHIYPLGEENASRDTYSVRSTDICVVDNEVCAMYIQRLYLDWMSSPAMDIYVENKTDKLLRFSWKDVSVNGNMVTPFIPVNIYPGAMCLHDVSIWGLDNNDIDTFTDIDFTLDVYDDNDWTAEHLICQQFTVFPQGKDKSQEYKYELKDSDIVLTDNDNYSIIYTGRVEDSIHGYELGFIMINKSDCELCFETEQSSINGVDCEPELNAWAEVMPGKTGDSGICWTNYYLERMKLTDVKEVNLTFKISNPDDASIEWKESVTFNIEN